MKMTLLVTLLFGIIFVGSVQAAEKTQTPQQQRMTACNKHASAGELKGDTRKTFMGDCLKNGVAGEKKGLTPQQQKMRECSAQATQQSLKGDDCSKFMSGCLKKQV